MLQNILIIWGLLIVFIIFSNAGFWTISPDLEDREMEDKRNQN